MTDVTQDNRPIAVTCDKLGKDKLLLEQFTVSEGISRPFRLMLTMLAQPDYTVPFASILGQNVSVRLDLPDKSQRYFHGVVYRLSEGSKAHSPDSGQFFIRYQAEVMPAVWNLNRQFRSRIFQHLSVPDILDKVFKGIDFTNLKSEDKSAFKPRDYCVQYRETDFQFASRLMEEEGIFYFFKHEQSSHKMILGNASTAFSDLPGGNEIEFNEFTGLRDKRLHEDRIVRWQKSQDLRTGAYRAWDYCFEEPTKNFEATVQIISSVDAGTISHSFQVGNNSQWEIYDFPGGFAQRFDGMDKSGSPQQADLNNIETDNTRTAKIRMEQEAVPGLVIEGDSNVRRFDPGYKIKLKEHFNANGEYLLTDVEHFASMAGTYTTDQSISLKYQNRFRSLPKALPFRPLRVTPKPTINGTQTAVVVGNDASTEIATDKYGRVKVQFSWDRDGKKTLDSSCWVRVSQNWAGKRWGVFFLPRVKDEVVVFFVDGDPDQPIIVGSVYNADQLPPYDLPADKTKSTIKTRSSEKGTTDNFNEIRFEDKKDSEEIFVQAEKDFNRVVKNNDTLKVGFTVKKAGDQTIDIYNNRTTTLDQGNEALTVKKGTRTVTVKGDDKHEVQQGNLTVTVDQGNASYKISQGACTIEAMQSLTLKVGSTTIKLTPTGITMQSTMIKLQASGMLQSQGGFYKITGDSLVQVQGGMVKIN
jgi:type VI secretion system secreted protein VgrG